MKVKICGNTNLDDAMCAVRAGADALGFVFYPRSPRYVTPKEAGAIVRELPANVEKIGVFVNESAERVREIAEEAVLTGVQLAGVESPQTCESLADSFAVIKVIHMDEAFRPEVLAGYQVASFLFDTPSRLFGGSGRTFDWSLLRRFPQHASERLRFYLAGGLSPENVEAAIVAASPDGVDVCSGVERLPGRKDHEKVQRFVAAARAACVEGCL